MQQYLLFFTIILHRNSDAVSHTKDEPKNPASKGECDMTSCNCNAAPASCGCGQTLPGVSPEAGLVLAMATVPMQSWETPYDPKTALKQGTVFPGLDKPFYVMGGVIHG